MLKFVKIIGKHENRAEFIKEIDNNYLVSGGADKKLLLYNNDLKILFEIKEKKWIYNALPYRKNFLKSTQIITCTSDKLFISEIDYRLREINEEMDISNCLNILELKNNDYMVLGNESLGIITNLNSKIIYNRKTVLDNKTFKGAIVINENEAVFTSNNILKNGGDVLVFFSMIEKKIKNEIKGYSFVNTVNGLTLIQREKKDGSILLCACKKYISGQKNGILLLNFKEDGKKEFNFYDTNNFEVYCFCPISVKKNTYILSDERNKRYYTDYFFVGGFDKDKKRGALKLYQIENEEANFKIKNINNIDFEDSIVFKNPISCIIQFRNTDNLLIASLDGNISQFKFDLNYILYINSQRRIIINA